MANRALLLPVAVFWLMESSSRARRVGEATQLLGRPTDRSVTLSVLEPEDVEMFVEYGTRAGAYSGKTVVGSAAERSGQAITC